jgi:hypothetical protein
MYIQTIKDALKIIKASDYQYHVEKIFSKEP